MGNANEIIRRLGKVMRESEERPDEQLPERWVELIRYLNERERREVSSAPSNS